MPGDTYSKMKLSQTLFSQLLKEKSQQKAVSEGGDKAGKSNIGEKVRQAPGTEVEMEISALELLISRYCGVGHAGDVATCMCVSS